MNLDNNYISDRILTEMFNRILRVRVYVKYYVKVYLSFKENIITDYGMAFLSEKLSKIFEEMQYFSIDLTSDYTCPWT